MSVSWLGGLNLSIPLNLRLSISGVRKYCHQHFEPGESTTIPFENDGKLKMIQIMRQTSVYSPYRLPSRTFTYTIGRTQKL